MDKKVVCKKCNTELNEAEGNFGKRTVNGKQYFRHLCKKCWNRYTNGLRGDSMTAGVYARRQEKHARERREGSARLITNTARSWDNKHGFMPDLDKEFVESLLSRGCEHCGATREEITIGLDRIDNALGHAKQNVVPACVRCNLTRKDMPWAAWLLVAPGMRAAREKGLFGMWVPGNRRKPLKVLAELDAAKADSPLFRTEREWNDVDHAGRVLGEAYLATRRAAV